MGANALARKCTKCGYEKNINKFAPQKDGPHGRQSACRICTAEYQRLNHLRAWLEEKMMDQPCSDCFKTFPFECMDWDHVEKKLACVRSLTDSANTPKNKQRLRDELLRCEYVCSNCHRTRTKLRVAVVRELRAAEEIIYGQAA